MSVQVTGVFICLYVDLVSNGNDHCPGSYFTHAAEKNYITLLLLSFI